jgi:hypothetical protein
MACLLMGIDIEISGIWAARFDLFGKQVSLFYKKYPLLCLETVMVEL